MQPIACKILSSAHSHLEQLFTGFASLAREGVIRCSEVFPNRSADPITKRATLSVLVDGSIKVVYDVLDRPDIDAELLAGADIYFKRSFLPSLIATKGSDATKVHPLGLNYEVFSNSIDPSRALRNFRMRRGIRRITGLFQPLKLSPGFVPRQEYLESSPTIDLPPKVLFLTRAWSPDEAPNPDLSKRQERDAINDMRANCIARLRAHFGDRVLAGFSHTEFAARAFPSLLVDDPRVTEKERYLAAVREHAVCVTTTGLHGSIGWKLGEYVALSRAVVSEPLNYSLPGAFVPNRNYLEFDSAEACVAVTDELMSNDALRASLMLNNFDYYRDFVRPDRLVLNSLLTAIAAQRGALSCGVTAPRQRVDSVPDGQP